MSKSPAKPSQLPALNPPSKLPKAPTFNDGGYRQATAIQRLLTFRMFQPDCSDLNLSKLALAWCSVEERKRILRGVPLPGQLRPDLDPVQVARAIKRNRDRSVMDVQAQVAAGGGTFIESLDQLPGGEKPTGEKKESLSTKEGPHGGGGGEG